MIPQGLVWFVEVVWSWSFLWGSGTVCPKLLAYSVLDHLRYRVVLTSGLVSIRISVPSFLALLAVEKIPTVLRLPWRSYGIEGPSIAFDINLYVAGHWFPPTSKGLLALTRFIIPNPSQHWTSQAEIAITVYSPTRSLQSQMHQAQKISVPIKHYIILSKSFHHVPLEY